MLHSREFHCGCNKKQILLKQHPSINQLHICLLHISLIPLYNLICLWSKLYSRWYVCHIVYMAHCSDSSYKWVQFFFSCGTGKRLLQSSLEPFDDTMFSLIISTWHFSEPFPEIYTKPPPQKTNQSRCWRGGGRTLRWSYLSLEATGSRILMLLLPLQPAGGRRRWRRKEDKRKRPPQGIMGTIWRRSTRLLGRTGSTSWAGWGLIKSIFILCCHLIGWRPSLLLSGAFKLLVLIEQRGKPAAVCETRAGEGARAPPRHHQVTWQAFMARDYRL